MSKEKMIEEIRVGLANRLGCPVYHTIVTKNNGVKLHGFRVGDGAVRPQLYWDEKSSVEEAIERLASAFKECTGMSVPDLESFREEQIFLRVALAKECAWDDCELFPMLDLVFIPYLLVDKNEDGVQSIRVTRELEQQLGFNLAEKFEQLKANTLRLFPVKVRSMASVLSRLGYQCEEVVDVPMLVVSNDVCVNGAASVLLSDSLARIAKNWKSDVWVLPSSVHELICVPYKELDSVEDFNGLVKEANTTCVDPEEVLSDHAYVFKRETGLLEVCE